MALQASAKTAAFASTSVFDPEEEVLLASLSSSSEKVPNDTGLVLETFSDLFH